ncbi:hypothetical protein P886_3183 [Alteromonadaceae bacterium 2753L.S.0a.02]|nr:hypothetical protein P886_3183 [Alteromonadaceae bacterium 2753L.S.0a.02]
MSATFQISEQDGLFTFNLLSGKGEQMLIGGEFENREAAEKAIQDVRVGSLMSQQIAAGKVASGETFFVIKDSAGQIIAKSLLYDNQMSFDAALHDVKDNACVAEISEMA